MPCENCAVQFSVFKRKRSCGECGRYYCTTCLRRGGGSMCGACRILSARPLGRQSILQLRVRDLQCFLHRQNVSTRGCVEKEELVNLVVAHVNSGSYRRRPPQDNPQSEFSSAFNSLKGITTNINSFINSALDLGTQCNDRINTMRNRPNGRENQNPVQTTATTDHPNSPNPSTSNNIDEHNQEFHIELENISVSVPCSTSPATTSTATSGHTVNIPEITVEIPSVRIENTDEPETTQIQDTSDCLEIEDLDDAAEWEFIHRPADPLPHNSGILLTDENNPMINRAASELDLRSSGSNETITDTSSLKDEPSLILNKNITRIQLQDITDASHIERLNVKQLKELLVLNRVDFKGCVERNELMERAKRLFRENAKSREDLDKLGLDDLCKICMDAPVECVMLECGHIATCTNCGKRLSECPICRQYIVRVVRFFRS